ncbi:hypothetical protein KL86DES1_20647 [uncultured Desulfovibrio sp.]|uniref:Uncharacterized protein n=1 Tax=uncultured Desulfovibrio sp. TaxID=167968 RepID=A0A212L4N9_9BACT|nr:hypothetical protein KL86DES1_20647 [uncultured Desulfovibrio sp.]VZH33549.1 conserved protein of unknown function [Desulfovibrio sp. 86]
MRCQACVAPVERWQACDAPRYDIFLPDNRLFLKNIFAFQLRCAALLAKSFEVFDFLLLTYATNKPYFVFDICRQ